MSAFCLDEAEQGLSQELVWKRALCSNVWAKTVKQVMSDGQGGGDGSFHSCSDSVRGSFVVILITPGMVETVEGMQCMKAQYKGPTPEEDLQQP